jgi:hypothetical protein
MKICSKCLREFEERENSNYNPVVALGDIYWERTIGDNGADLCPECREELGMFNLIGSGK